MSSFYNFEILKKKKVKKAEVHKESAPLYFFIIIFLRKE